MPSVLIIQEHLPAFRVGFYDRLREILGDRGIDLHLVYAPNQRNTFQKGKLDWANPVSIRWFGPFGWQPVLLLARRADLVVVQQENKYAINPVLQFLAGWAGPRVAFWGHGRNFQAEGSGGWTGAWKRWMAKKVHWWFAYNDLSARVVESCGFPSQRITSVMNAIDTTALRHARQSLDENVVARLRDDLGLVGNHVAVYTGGLYPLKRIGYLLEVCCAVRRRIPDFEMIFIGSGPDGVLLEEASRRQSWIRWVGPKSDIEKVPYWAMAKLLLMPGGVGLVVLDSFALGVPMVTNSGAGHGPEIDYLRSGENGLMVDGGGDPEVFATAVCALFEDPMRLESMRRAALDDGPKYSVENMATRFADGIEAALKA